MGALTPREIVQELDKYIVGQDDAKRAVAIALRNRWRRQQLAPELRNEVAPKNIIMIGPTGVGKTEVARRLASLAHSPFLKIEASKFTEVGYVGRDVESMIRDLTELSKNMVQQEEMRRVQGEGRRERRGAIGWICCCRIRRAPRRRKPRAASTTSGSSSIRRRARNSASTCGMASSTTGSSSWRCRTAAISR